MKRWLAQFEQRVTRQIVAKVAALGPEWLPFADIGTTELPLSRLLRLSLFQLTVGMALTLLIGTLNRVMIVELGLSASVVGLMIALPLLAAPFRALVGFRSDTHVSFLGWRRVPYIWLGTMLQWGGLAIMPMALILMSGDTTGPAFVGPVAAALAFLLVGAGMHMVQTVGLALATDLAPPAVRPKVVALLCGMLLIGMIISSLVFGLALRDYNNVKLIQVVQGAAVITMMLNTIALWKQEPRNAVLTAPERARPDFATMWADFTADPKAKRRLLALGLGTAAFSMQDVLLEPYAGQILGLSVAATTALTALFAVGGMIGLGLAAYYLGRGVDPYRVAGSGAVVGLVAFLLVTLAAPLNAPSLFASGAALIGFGGGLFAHATLTAAMQHASTDDTGFALGVWGAVQASAAGLAIASGGALRDVVGWAAEAQRMGTTLAGPATGYGIVYTIEIILLFATLVAVGPLVGADQRARAANQSSDTSHDRTAAYGATFAANHLTPH
jgi:MFS transporter, BCD family, chlorophyll transporter